MKKSYYIILIVLGIMLAMARVAVAAEYVGDKKAQFFYENPRALNTFLVKVRNSNKTIIVGYYKRTTNGWILSQESMCCKSLNLSGGSCFVLEKGLNLED